MTFPRIIAVTVDTSKRIHGFGGEQVPVEYEYEWEDDVRSRGVTWMTTENAIREVQAHAVSNTEGRP